MTLKSFTFHSILIFSLLVIVSSQPYQYLDDFDDLRGDYCRSRQFCCHSRVDSCSVPILGTLCYCDEFCNSTRVNDCCPDYWSFCQGIEPPPTTTPRWTTRPPIITSEPPEEVREPCVSNGVRYYENQEFKDNCVLMRCERESYDNFHLVARPVSGVIPHCIIDPEIVHTISSNPGQYGWTATNYSEFWGRTLDDGVLYRLGTLPPQKFVLKMNPVRRIYDPTALPRDFSSEEVWPGFISGIQDQGWCGSSWAISSAAVASDRYAIVSKGIEQVQLSSQNLISCDTNGQQSCNGGHLDRAWAFIKVFGLVDEECFPYTASNSTCRIKRRGPLRDAGCNAPRYHERTARYTVGPAYRLGNETDIMYEIIKSGPVQATMKVYQDFFTYEGGIYKHSDLDLNRKHGYHSVRIVGWGEEPNYLGTQKYWIVANSWGQNWGEDGYFRIAKGTNECDIESFVLATWPRVERKVLLQNENRI